ncbi:MAG: hypothetical protein H7Z73_00940, partial [Candidatus Saccharibacteria bacterium]|nr:hypothetical protein [Moraxellaceae bacterium]
MPINQSNRIFTLELAMRAFAIFSTLSVAIGAAMPAQAADGDFIDAQRAARSRDWPTLDLYREQMHTNLLAPYPEYWKLNNNLAQQLPQVINTFLVRYPNSAISEKLLVDYIEAKVGA